MILTKHRSFSSDIVIGVIGLTIHRWIYRISNGLVSSKATAGLRNFPMDFSGFFCCENPWENPQAMGEKRGQQNGIYTHHMNPYDTILEWLRYIFIW